MRTTSPDPEVFRLRGEMAAIDRSIVLLLGARAGAQRRLFARKRALGLPLRDPHQEARVLDRVKDWAERYGVDGSLAERTIRHAIRAGLREEGRPLAPSTADGPVTVYVAPGTMPAIRPFRVTPMLAPRGGIAQLLTV